MTNGVEIIREQAAKCAHRLPDTVRESFREWKAALPVYVFVLALYLILFMVIPSAGSSDASLRALKESAPEMDKIGAFFRRLQGYVLNLIENIRSLTFEKVIGILKDLSKNTIDILRAVPSHIGNFISNFSQIARKQWALLKETLRQLWPPRLAWERLKEFAALHKQQIQKLTEAVAGGLASVFAVKLFALFVVPFLGLGAIVVLGVDISIGLLFVLRWVASRIGRSIGENLPGQAGVWWDHHETQRAKVYHVLDGKLKGFRRTILQSFQSIGNDLENQRTERFKAYEKYVEQLRPD